MMDFRTKLDYSSNRQILQNEKTFTHLSGATSFGLPFSALTSGPDPNHSGVTSVYLEVIGTFSGDTGTTIYTWYDTSMQLAAKTFIALTPSNSGETQESGNIFTGDSKTIIDGNLVNLSYSGINFSITPISLIDFGTYYSGTVYTPIVRYLTADTLDYTGRCIWVDVSGITRTEKLIVLGDATFSNIGSQASYGALHYTSAGTLTVNTSDARLKTNITNISNPLDKVINLKGIYYNWISDPNGQKRLGFVAQEVKDIVPELVFVNKNSPNEYLGVHYDNVTPLLVEAIKELNNKVNEIEISTSNVVLTTQTIVAEDNNIELNYNGTHETSIGGGISVINGIEENLNSELKIDKKGNWITNTDFKPNALTIPFYKPKSSTDTFGNTGNLTTDYEYIYLKVSDNNWKRIKLEDF